MAVSVFPDRGKVSQEYEKAQHVRIVDGHLYVTGQNTNDLGDVFAIYAPGQWHHADTDE